MTTRAQRVVIIGQIAGVFGVRGWMKIYSHTEPREAILRHRVWFIYRDGEWRPLELLAGRVHGKGIVAHLKDSATPEQARAFIRCDIGVLRVLTQEGVDRGAVDHLLETGANDVLGVRGERERLIPYIRGEVVTAGDLEQGVMRVAWDPEFCSMRFDVITLFPELFEIATRHGVTGRAVKKGRVTLALWNPRDYTHDRHRTVDVWF